MFRFFFLEIRKMNIAMEIKWIVAGMLGCFVAFSFSCSKKDQQPKLLIEAKEPSCATDAHMSRKSQITTAGIVAEKYLWPNNPEGPIVIRVKFLDGGSAYLHAKVKQYAKQWEEYANFRFDFVNRDVPAEIRIGFNQERDTYVWAIGTYLLDLSDDDQYNMHYAGLDDDSLEERIAGDVLHEFGHVLGLMHEQYHPKARWNKDYMYTHYKRTKGWSEEEVDENFFGYSVPEPLYSKRYDKESVMHSQYLGKFIANGCGRLGGNKLSEGDKKFVQRLYPFPKKKVSG